MQVRPFRGEDTDAVYDVCLRTGASGADATGQADVTLFGDVWAGPYLAVAPHLAYIAEDEQGVAGYVLGALDTRAFEAACEQSWWPPLRRRHEEPTGSPATWTLPDRLAYLVHHPPQTPDDVLDGRPSHLHVNLLPRAQGQGHGATLTATVLTALSSAGSPGVHLGVDPTNVRAQRFYVRQGFAEIARDHDVVWLGRALPA